MRETGRDKGRLEHILDAIEKAEEFTKNTPCSVEVLPRLFYFVRLGRKR